MNRPLLATRRAAGLGVLLGVLTLAPLAAAQPGSKDQPRQPGRPAHARQDDPQQTGAAIRQRFVERLKRVLVEMREDQEALSGILARLEDGAPFEEIRGLIPERMAARFRPAPDEAGPREPDSGGERGPRRMGGDRAGPNRADEPFSEEDWQAVRAIIKHAQPDMLEKFEELRLKDADLAQRKTLEAYPRLFPLLDLRKRDPESFDLRLEEMAIAREALPLARKIIDARRAGTDAGSPELDDTRAKLRELAKRQYENRLAMQKRDLESFRQHLERRRKELEDQTRDSERGIDRSLEGLIRQAERGGNPTDGPEAGEPGRRGGPPGGEDGPPRQRRRPND